jgi:carbonic anhydrase
MIEACADRLEVQGSLVRMAKKVQPIIERSSGQPGDLVENAARANAVMIAENLKTRGPVLPGLVKAGALKVIPAFYDLETGEVDWQIGTEPKSF